MSQGHHADPPSFLSLASMVVDDREEIVRELIRAERKAPAIYDPAREIFCRILQGDFSYDDGLKQAFDLHDKAERQCATAVLSASKSFLISEKPAKVGRASGITFRLPNGLDISVSPFWIRHSQPDRVLVLHFWRKPLSTLQLSAAGTILRNAVTLQRPSHAFCEIDFISVSETSSSNRRFRRYDWERVQPLSEEDLSRFLKRFCDAWAEYQKRQPQRGHRGTMSDLFNTH